jgi:hypothetical protein
VWQVEHAKAFVPYSAEMQDQKKEGVGGWAAEDKGYMDKAHSETGASQQASVRPRWLVTVLQGLRICCQAGFSESSKNGKM